MEKALGEGGGSKDKFADDLAAVVDPDGVGLVRIWHDDGREDPLLQEESTRVLLAVPPRNRKDPDYGSAPIVDSPRRRGQCLSSGHVDCDEVVRCKYKAANLRRSVKEVSDDFAAIVDAVRRRERPRLGMVETGELAP